MSKAFDEFRPAPARRYDYLLGGKDNFAADRASAALIAEHLPQLETAIHANRGFVHRAVRYLAAECGIRQFLDIGCGLPTHRNVHEVAQDIDPAARVVYVDNDSQVMVHARALLLGTREGAVGYAETDVRDPWTLLADPAVRDTLDFRRPVGVLLCAVLHFIVDDELARSAVAGITSALASGSYVAISHATVDPLPETMRLWLAEMAESGEHGPFRARSRAEVEEFLAGLEPVPPGLVATGRWRPDRGQREVSDEASIAWAAVARVP